MESKKRENIIALQVGWLDRRRVKTFLDHFDVVYREDARLLKSVFYIQTNINNATLLENAWFYHKGYLAEWPAQRSEL